jgi:Melibiase/Glycosyl hydrolase family 36 C-terminal domain
MPRVRSCLRSVALITTLDHMTWTSLAVTCLLLLSAGHLSAQRAKMIHMANADTSITLEAGTESPRLAQLRFRDVEGWQGQVAEALPDRIESEGKTQPVRWKLNQLATTTGPAMVRLIYESQTPRLRAFWEWRARAIHGPIEHSIRIQNLSGKEIWLPLQDSLRFDWRIVPGEKLEQLWIEKGAGGPSAEGTHRNMIDEGYEWTGESSTYAHPAEGQQREMIPYVLVQRDDSAHTGWYMGIEFSGRTRITLRRKGDSFAGAAGLNPEPGPFRTRLKPEESLETPTVFIGAFRGGDDAAGNTVRRWVREVLNNPVALGDPHYPLLVNNSWGSGMAIDEKQARSMIRDSAELGFEMFHLDAGWFRGVGDWYPDPEKFPHGLAAVAEYAHDEGLKFGLWMDWAQASLDQHPGSLYINNPKTRDWLVSDPPPNWTPGEAFKGITIDLGLPAAHDWADKEVSRVVNDYHLDMLEHDGYVVAQGCDRSDHPHAPPDPLSTRRFQDSGFLWVESSNSTDVSYRATLAYYDIYAHLRKQHPNLLLEICNDGGRMVDFGSAAHGDYFSISDAYDPLSNRRAFYDASYVLPPAMLESYVEKWPAPRMENFLYVIRSGMMGWFTLMLDTTAWTAEQHAAAREAIDIYKSRLRPFIREADLYHVTPRPDGIHWDGVEYFDAARRRGVLFAFRGSSPEENAHRFVLQGLRPAAFYRLMFQDHSSRDETLSGRELMNNGLQVSLEVPESSELVFLQER